MSASPAVTAALAGGMLATGALNTLLNKLQDNECVAGCGTREERRFEQPVFQTINMFAGEVLCLLALASASAFRRARASRGPFINLPVHSDDDDDDDNDDDDNDEYGNDSSPQTRPLLVQGRARPRRASSPTPVMSPDSFASDSHAAGKRDAHSHPASSRVTQRPHGAHGAFTSSLDDQLHVVALGSHDDIRNVTNDSSTAATQQRHATRAPSSAKGRTWTKAAWLVVPAMCDLAGSTLMNIGLIYVSASVYQMLRGAVILFTALFSTVFLKRRFPPYRWLGVCVVVIGIAIVGLSSVLKAPVKDRASGGDNQDHEGDDVPADILWLTILGIAITTLAQAFTAAQYVVEERILASLRIPVLGVVGIEGTAGLTMCTMFLLVLYPTVGKHAGDRVPQAYFDVPATLRMVAAHPLLVHTSWMSALSIAFFNFFGISVTSRVSATARALIDSCRTVLIWSVAILAGWETFGVLQLFGFVLLVSGTLIFNDVVSLRPCLGSWWFERFEPSASFHFVEDSDDVDGAPNESFAYIDTHKGALSPSRIFLNNNSADDVGISSGGTSNANFKPIAPNKFKKTVSEFSDTGSFAVAEQPPPL